MYSIRDLSRREILMMSAVLAGSGVVFSPKFVAAEAALQRTPDQILRPFYPLSQLPQTSDLTRVSGRSGRAEGQVLNVMGRVLNLAGEPVRDARVEVWQANTYGRYTHPSDPNPAPLDPSFEGSAVLTTDSEGRYRFKTIKPAAYPAGPNRMRPAHIHFHTRRLKPSPWESGSHMTLRWRETDSNPRSLSQRSRVFGLSPAPRRTAKALAAVPALPHSERRLLPHRGFLWWYRLLPGGRLRRRRIEGIFDGLACVESHCLAGRDFDALPGSWISPLACGPRRHIENAEAGDTDRLAGQEALENGVYHGLHRLARRR